MTAATALSQSYARSRASLTQYFDRTAFDAWARLTSDAPVSRIRAKVRAGRDRMRDTLLGFLPADMTGLTLLDAGCGTGALSVEAARRGAKVTAIDVSAQLIGIARERAPTDLGHGSIAFEVGDMASPRLGRFDHVVAMDSLIHYRTNDIAAAVASLAERTERSIAFTIAPRTPALNILWAVGKLFPRSDRSPAIIPAGPGALARKLTAAMPGWHAGRSTRVSASFYTSQALEWRRA